MQVVIDVPEKYYKDAKRMVWSSTYSGSLISGWLRNGIPVIEKDGYFVTDDYTANMCTTQDRRCDICEHSEEQDGSNCYECVKGMTDNFEAQPIPLTHSRDGDINDTETCHECMWNSKYEPKRW